jgi:trigger factor
VKVTVERIPESQVRLAIEAGQEEQDEAIEKAYRKVAQQVVIPGFRKGKAPRSMIERVYGREVFVEEANRSLMDRLYRQAIEQEDLIPVGEPEVDNVEPEPFSFTVVVPVYPQVDPGPYTDVRIEPVDASIDEDAVNDVLENLRLQHSPWVDPAEPRTPKERDQITVDLRIMDGDKDFMPATEDAVFVLGESNLLKEIRTAVDKLKVGETGVEEVTFGGDDERVAEGDPRRGKTLTYSVTLKGLKERDLLPLDDDFAKTYASAESLEDLKTRIRTNMHIDRTREARNEAVNKIVDEIEEGATLEIPAPMIDEAVERRLRRLRGELEYNGLSLEAYLRQLQLSEEEFRVEVRPSVTESLRRSLILREIAEREGIEVSDSELESEIEGIAAQAPEREKMRDTYLSNQYLRSAVRNDMFDQRLTDRLIEIATEGQSAVVNGWTPPAADDSESNDESGGARSAAK